MKPSPIHYVFAHDLPFKGYLACWAIFGIGVVISVCQPSRAMFSDWSFCALFVISLLLAPVLFMFLSLPVSFLVLVPAYYLGDRLAGAPFRVGDHVRILIGPYRDRVVEIYDVWDSRRQVRVRLDAQLEREVRDVFSFTQVLREHAAS
jgi:hypothetical protein